MGLFSSKKKVYVGTSVSRVMEDEALPDSIKTGVIKAIFQDGDIPAYAMEELVSNIGMRAERMFEYAAKHYVHGLPSGQILSASQGREQVEAILSAIEGVPVLLDYCHFGPPNSLHIAWMQLIANHGYNPVTNQLAGLSAQKGAPVYLDDMVVTVPAASVGSFEPGALDQWGTPARAGKTPWRPTASPLSGAIRAHSPVYASPTAVEDFVRVDYVWEAATYWWRDESSLAERKRSGQFNIPITDALADNNADYFHAKYTLNGVPKYWLYKVGTGTYPELDALFDAQPETTGTYFPFVHFRSNAVSEISNKTTESYKTSRKLVKYLGMDFDAVAEAIDANPDIADVHQAMLAMAVPANTANPLEQRYLFEFFDNLFYAKDRQYSDPMASTLRRFFDAVAGSPRSSIVIQDRRFKMALSDAGIYKKRVFGSIGALGSHASGMRTETVEQPYRDSETGEQRIQYQNVTVHFYRRQVSQHFYDEVSVANLRMVYHVYGNYTTTGDETDNILLIPIDRAITRDWTIKDREVLYARSLHYIFNSVQIVKVKWYQTGIFKVIATAVAIAMAIYDGGATLGVVLGLTGAAAVIATIIVNLIISKLMAIAFKLFVKVLGEDLALLAAVVALVAGAYQIIDAGSVAGAPWAKDLLTVSNGLTTAAMESKFAGLANEYTDFSSFVVKQTETLEKAQDLLESKTHLNPFVIFGESPSDYYNRTVHSGNIGVLGINAVSSYIDVALTLPKLNDTVGETFYG